MQIAFHGAAGEVTGSCHLVSAGARRILLDCGLFQGGRLEQRRNQAAFPFDAARLDAVVLSHAHIDHVGRLPLLCRRGYRGPIYTHTATADLARIMLEDAARLSAADAERENRQRAARGLAPIAPAYGQQDIEQALDQMKTLAYGQWREIVPGIEVQLQDAGHIIGAAIVTLLSRVEQTPKRIVFSADIGPRHAPVMRDPTPVREADLVIMESTYGDRLHRPRAQTVAELGEIFEQAHREQGMVLIPAFAVGRTQEILYWMARHHRDWGLDRWQIVVDSPMAARVVDIYLKYANLLDPESQEVWARRLSNLPNLRLVADARQSQQLNERRGGAIIIAGSGMCNGGRIVHHLRHHLARESTHVVIVGYQAQGTLGRELVDRRPDVRIFGQRIPVRAHIHTVGGLSAHADQAGLLEWYGHFENRPPVCLVHGEDAARQALAQELQRRYGSVVTLAAPGMRVDA